MACDPAGLPPELVESYATGRLTPLVGPKVSKLADPEIPTWAEFLDLLLAAAGTSVPESELERLERFRAKGQFRRAASVVVKHTPSEVYYAAFEASFTSRRTPSPAHIQLAGLAPLVLTTNYDTLIEDAFATESRRAPSVFTFRSAEALIGPRRGAEDSGLAVLKIFGSAEDPFGIVFDEASFADARFSTALQSVLYDTFTRTTVVALGYAPSDAAAQSVFELVPELPRRHFVVFGADEAGADADSWMDRYGMQPVFCGPDTPILDFLQALP